MNSLKKYSTNKKIGMGNDGDVYAIMDNLCIKIATIYHYDNINLSDRLSTIKFNINYLIKHKCKPFARVYDFEIIKVLPNKVASYSYTMERYINITDDEYKVFHTVLSHEDRNLIKDISKDNLEKTLKGLSYGLDFNYDRVIMFCDLLEKSRIKHLDLHPRNIMKDKVGNFKLVDLDRLYLEK